MNLNEYKWSTKSDNLEKKNGEKKITNWAKEDDLKCRHGH